MDSKIIYGTCYCDAENFYLRTKQRLLSIAAGEYALVSVDFDNFNFINDLFGYDVGNQTLKCITESFAENMKAGELFSRIHADHFVFFVKISVECSLEERFSKITDLSACMNEILPSHYSFVCSGGIVTVDDGNESLSSLLDKANFARKQAKGNHLSTFLRYDKKMSEELEWKKIITLTMESALREREFEVYLQPKILMQTGEIMGAEALVRWNSPKYGMIYPDRFIPILEQNGFIEQLDFFMLDRVCLFLKENIELDIVSWPISVNFSKVHIRTPDFVDKVARVVTKHGIDTGLIEIELTESVFAYDFQTLISVAGNLKQLGFSVSLDDFGRAYSSLNYLKDLPLDVIKIDRGFLQSYDTEKGRIMIAKMVDLIKSLNLKSLMEGMESAEEVEFLKHLNCDLGQGYFYARPMPSSAYREVLRTGKMPVSVVELSC